MTTLSQISDPDLVGLIDIEFRKQIESLPRTAENSGLFKIDEWQDHTGNTRLYSEMHGEEYASEKQEGNDAESTKIQRGYDKLMTLTRFAKTLKVTWEMRKRNKQMELMQELTNIVEMIPNRRELDLQHRLTFGTAASYVNQDGRTVDVTVGDGLSLFNTAHTLKGSATTFRNRLAGNPQLSKGSLESMESLVVTQTLNHFGAKMHVPHDILWITDDPNTRNTAFELNNSESDMTQANPGVVNVNKSKYKIVILNRLATDAKGAPDATKAKYWGIASSKYSTAYLGIEERENAIPPIVGSNSETFSTQDLSWLVTGSWGICIVGANWIKMSSGDGTP